MRHGLPQRMRCGTPLGGEAVVHPKADQQWPHHHLQRAPLLEHCRHWYKRAGRGHNGQTPDCSGLSPAHGVGIFAGSADQAQEGKVPDVHHASLLRKLMILAGLVVPSRGFNMESEEASAGLSVVAFLLLIVTLQFALILCLVGSWCSSRCARREKILLEDRDTGAPGKSPLQQLPETAQESSKRRQRIHSAKEYYGRQEMARSFICTRSAGTSRTDTQSRFESASSVSKFIRMRQARNSNRCQV